MQFETGTAAAISSLNLRPKLSKLLVKRANHTVVPVPKVTGKPTNQDLAAFWHLKCSLHKHLPNDEPQRKISLLREHVKNR